MAVAPRGINGKNEERSEEERDEDQRCHVT
jgi:hypothetical protein